MIGRTLVFALGSSLAALHPVQAQQEVWIGTAPFCGASASDCTRRGMDFVRSDNTGDGKKCSTGTKVLCRARSEAAPTDEVKVWLGTAPTCNVTPQDCARNGLSYVQSDVSGDGAKCLTGTKVLCRGTRAAYRPQPEGVTADLAPLAQAAADAARIAKSSLTQGAVVIKQGFDRFGCAFVRETDALGGMVPFPLAAQCGMRQAVAVQRALASPQVQRFLSAVRQPIANLSRNIPGRIQAIQQATQSGNFSDVAAAAGLGAVLAAAFPDGSAGGDGTPNLFDATPVHASFASFRRRRSPESCASGFDASQANTASIGWTVVDASLGAGGTYEFGGIYRLPRGERTGRDQMLYHSGTFTMSLVSYGVDTGFSFGFWCTTVPQVGMQKSWGATLAGTYGIGGSFTLWFDGSFSDGTEARMSGISFNIAGGGSVEMEFTRACTNYQLVGARSFGALSGDCVGSSPARAFVARRGADDASVINVAVSKRTAQSSTLGPGESSRAVDGELSGRWQDNSVTHTDIGPGNWWMVDLGAEYEVRDVQVYNRTDCCSERLNATLAVTATEGWPLRDVRFQQNLGSVGEHVRVAVTSPERQVFGRYVYVFLNTNDYLSLAEVQVNAIPRSTAGVELRNVAIGKRSAQSSTAFGGTSDRAVDGGMSGLWPENSVTHTAQGAGNWWMVDLGAEFEISNIEVHNRTDCCSERLNAMVAVTGAEGWPLQDVRFGQDLGPPRERIRIPVSNASTRVYGRYVYVYLKTADFLSLAEVEVFAIPR